MISRIVQHINATTVLAFIALIFATTGGALAVNDHGGAAGKAASATSLAGSRAIAPAASSSKAKSKSKVGPRGPRGPAGPAGPAGAVGKNGANGAAGPQGEKGSAGTTGTNGTNGGAGESVTVSTPSSNECNGEGGAKVSNTSGSATACNGKTGYTNTLPKDKTETGVWTVAANSIGYVFVPISFPIPLAAGTAGSAVITNVHFLGLGETAKAGEGCGSGTVEKPEAEPGNLCVYTSEASPAILPSNVSISDPALPSRKEGAGATGANLKIFVEELSGGVALGEGTWAVSAE